MSMTVLIHRRVEFFIIILSLAVFCFGPQAGAQSNNPDDANRGTIGLVTGEYGELSLRLASDLAAVLDEGDNLRVLNVAGRGALSNIGDLLFLKGMDVTIVPADVLDYAEKNHLFPDMKFKLRFISRLYIQEVHLVAGKGIKSVSDLRGKKINVVSRQHGSFVTAKNLFSALDIDYEPVFFDQRLALEKLKQGGISAALIVSGRPSPLLLEQTGKNDLHIIPMPFSDKLPAIYFPVNVSSADYPSLIKEGQSVATVGTTAVMIVYNFKRRTKRYAKMARFIDAFLSRFGEFLKQPRHVRWRDVNLTATLDGWERFAPVAEWLKNNNTKLVALRQPGKKKRSIRQLFKEFIDWEVSTGQSDQLLRLDKKDLFKRFILWQENRRKAKSVVKKKPRKNRSLKVLFRHFIDAEVGRVGKTEVLGLPKNELYRRFLRWRERETARQ